MDSSDPNFSVSDAEGKMSGLVISEDTLRESADSIYEVPIVFG